MLVTHNAGLGLINLTGKPDKQQDQLDSLINNFPQTSVNNMLKDRNNNLWIGTFYGLFLLDMEGKKFVNFKLDQKNPVSMINNGIRKMYEDDQGCIWIGTENGGLNVIDLKSFSEDHCTFIHYHHNPVDIYSISSNTIYSLFKDNQGTLWFDTYGGGVNYYNKILDKFNHFYHIPNNSNSISNNMVNAILEEDWIYIIRRPIYLNIMSMIPMIIKV